jgi:feruloyl esterase
VLNGNTTTAAVSLCRVVGNINPSTNPAGDSNINFEVWQPTANWTGRYEQVGNGGFAGSIVYGSLRPAAGNNNATASTDDGSSQPAGAAGGSFALGHPQKINDYGHRAVHRTDLDAQVIVTAFYGTPPAHRYFNGCSKGGQEAFMEAQRYPDDFDGIMGGAAASDNIPLLSGFLWDAQQTTNPNNPSGFIPNSALANVTNAVQTACASDKTVPTDNFLADPTLCTFNPQTLFMPFLTPAQITAITNVYNGVVTNVGVPPFNVAAGYEPGNEAQLWPGNVTEPTLTTTPATSQFFFGNGAFTYFQQQTPATYNSLLQFNVNTGPAMLNDFLIDPPSPGSAVQTVGSALNANNPDLTAFKSHGGKLVQYHGWADPLVASLFSVNHFSAVVAFEQQQGAANPLATTQSYYRLFMAPGMGHCGGGPGLNSFGQSGGSGPASSDMFTALETWVEQGIAPAQIIATNAPQATFTRPLCPYPQHATYTGTGSTSQAANFVCQ